MGETHGPVVSVMLAVADAGAAAAWYQQALGAEPLWSLGSVVGLDIGGAAFFLGQPAGNGWATPHDIGTTTTRVEVFVDDPDAFVERAVRHGARPSAHGVVDHVQPWGTHRQGSFTDPFGHLWFVGDRSPLAAQPSDRQ
jgi:uncharacterized glyoxalase superfamily protein PhnB